MTSGITRYTKGAYNASAILDVYNKAKEIYQDPDTPPSSGVIVNTTDEIWDDMTAAPTAYTVSTNSNYEMQQGPLMYGFLPHTNEPLWEKTNAWMEIEEAAAEECPRWYTTPQACADAQSCAPTISTAINTAVEITPPYMAIRDGDVWRETFNGTGDMGGTISPSEDMAFTGNRGCDVFAIETIRQDNNLYNPHIGSTGLNELYFPRYYYRYHGWGVGSPLTDPNTITAIYHCQYARLVLIDPNGVDDRHKARFCMHSSSDIKAADGTMIPNKVGWGVGGISRFKLLPTNGDWMPMNFLEGWITKADLEANPPPFPTTP